MKVALIALLCFGAAFARFDSSEWSWLNRVSPSRNVEDTAFRPGREYQFFYNAQLTTGIPGSSKQHSAHRIQAIVAVAIKSQNNVILRLENIRIGKMNRLIPSPRKIMPFDAFEDAPIDQQLQSKLHAPVKFSYINGLVRDIQFDSKEDPWTANIKRGVLNLLQVNLQQHRRVDTPEESILVNSRSRGEVDSQPQFFRVMEETLEGECETLYSIQEQPNPRHSPKPVLNVTKSINFEKCNKRPVIKYNFRFADKCPTCNPEYDDDEKFLKSSTVIQYNITGNKQNFLIDSARVESQYVFTPFNEEANVIVTYVNQTLVLVKTGPIQNQQEPQNPVKSDSNMIYTLDWFVAQEKSIMQGGSSESFLKRLRSMTNERIDVAANMKKIMRKLMSEMKEQVDEQLPQHFSQLLKWLRVGSEHDVEQLANMQDQGLSQEEERKAKNVIPQLLGACGTKDCVKVLVQKIRHGQIVPLRGVLALRELLHSRAVSKEMINELIQLAESDKTRESEPLKSTAWLTIGSLVNALCAENEDQLAVESKEDVKKLCGREQKDTYVKLLFNKLRQSNKWQDKLLMLRTIGNAGLDLSIFELEKIILQQNSASHPMYLRMEAILALRQLKDGMPKKIQRMLMPIAMNRREYPTLRSIASYVILGTQPERAILDQMARSLINEPSHQFAAFLYSQLQSYANSTNPCEEQLSTDATLALRQAKQVSNGLGYSKFSHSTFHNENQNVGLDVELGAIFSNVSSIPRRLGLALHTNRLGYWQKYLVQLSLFNEGLEPLMRELYTKRGNLLDSQNNNNNMKSLLNFFNRHHATPQQNYNEYEQELDDIFSKHLKIQQRNYGSEYENEPKAYFIGMFKSQTTTVLPISRELVQQLVQDGRNQVPELVQKMQRGIQVDYSTISQVHDLYLATPTTFGVPLIVSLEAPLALSIKGKVQAKMQSAKLFQVQAELKPSVVATTICEVRAFFPLVVSGVKVQAKAKLFTPIDAKVDVELEPNAEVKIQIKPPTQKRDLVILESRPVTFTQDWQQYLKSADEQSTTEELTIVGEEMDRVATFNKCYGRQTLGVDVCVRGQVQHPPHESVTGTPSFPPFAGQNKIVLSCQPSESNQDIQIKINGKSQKINGQDMHMPSFSFLSNQAPFENSGSSSSSDSSSTSEESSSEETGRLTTTPRTHRHTVLPHNRDIFQEYRQYQVKTGSKANINVEVQAGNGKRLNLEWSHVVDYNKRYGQVSLKLDRQHPEQWQACFDAEMMYPEQPEFFNEVRDKKVLSHAQLRWGQSCSSQNYIQIATQAERSKQQMQWEREQSEYKRYNAKERCENNKGWCSPLAQRDFVEKISHMLKYRVDVDYQNVPPVVQNVTNKLYRALKYYYYWQTDIDQITASNPQGKIRAELVLDPETKQRVNVTIKSPKESVMIQDMPLCSPVLAVNQKQSFANQLKGYVNDEEEDENSYQCSITGKHGLERRSKIETFDGTSFTAPFTDCWVVLAKDCGSSRPEFVVMARKSATSGSDLKDVKIVTRQHRIELKPDSAEYNSVKVTVNGKPYDPENDEDLLEHGSVVAQINKEDQSISVDLQAAGVEVQFDGYAINIQLSPYYQGQQCGLCGHFDLESADEFRNPDFTEEKDLRQFYMNYMIKDGNCQAPKQLTEVCESEECDKSSGSSSSSSSSSGSSSSGSSEQDGDNDVTTEKPDQKTKVIEIDDQICFSTVPVPQCDDDAYPTEIKQQKSIPYTCMDQDSESAEEFERKARYGKKAIQALNGRQPNFTRTESIPEKCKKYNN